ncbi:hypothetical protein GGR42_000580 [Saonia flava]|uniref:Uncharacterized protein n=1 Tax=Saonia flava TaxID=523696 RepID=A0A846QPT4_9FLAO|nr:hypothetical protein [Saonia flava]
MQFLNFIFDVFSYKLMKTYEILLVRHYKQLLKFVITNNSKSYSYEKSHYLQGNHWIYYYIILL